MSKEVSEKGPAQSHSLAQTGHPWTLVHQVGRDVGQVSLSQACLNRRVTTCTWSGFLDFERFKLEFEKSFVDGEREKPWQKTA